MRKVQLLIWLCLSTLSTYAQSSLQWDGFQRSQESVQDVATYLSQNSRANLSALQSSSESRVGFSPMVDPQTPSDAQPLMNEGSETFTLVFSDEFNGAQIDTAKWTVQDNFFRDRGDIKLYADGNQVEQKDGHLYIYYLKDTTRENSYLAGRVDSRGKYATTYGFLETKIHLVKPNGHQTAFWMMPEGNGMSHPEGVDGTANNGAEIDIIEGNRTNSFACGLHWDGYGSAHRSNGKSIEVPGMHNIEYHVVGFEWDKNYLRWYLNGEIVRELTNPRLIPHVPHFILFSGSMWGESNWVDDDIRNNEFIQNGGVDKAYIDYVRVYQKQTVDHRPVLRNSKPSNVE